MQAPWLPQDYVRESSLQHRSPTKKICPSKIKKERKGACTLLPSSRVRLLPCQRSSAENLFAAPRFAARVLSAPSTSAMQCPVGRSSCRVEVEVRLFVLLMSPLTTLVPQPTFSSQMRTMSSTDLLCKCSENSVTVDETFKDGPTVILQSRSRWFPTEGGRTPTLPSPPKNTAELGVGESH